MKIGKKRRQALKQILKNVNDLFSWINHI